MSSIIETSIKRPLLILVVFATLTLGGLVCYNLLNLNLLPKIELPTITITTVYPGAGASEVETSVTKKIEDALSTLENLKKISSVSQESVSNVTVQLGEGTDANLSIQETQRKINAIRLNLPEEILEPSINKISMDEQPIMRIAASSSLSPIGFFKLMEDRIQPRLAKLPGVGAVDVAGGNEREIQVNIDTEKLQVYRLSVLQVLQAIQSANIEIPAGNVENNNATYSVRLTAKYSSLDDLRNTVISVSPQGGEVKVSDVAEVVDGIAEQKLINRINGRDAIGISIQKQNDANAVEVAGLAKAELATIESEYANDGVRFEIAMDDSVFTKASANAVIIDLILAVVIVSIVCFVFLHSLRSASIIMISVPLSIIPAFIGLYVMGYSLNMMSLMAISLVVGILVDDSIVVIENMFHHIEQGKSSRRAAIDGCKQIMFTVVGMTMVLVVVFIPLAIAGGLIGNILKEFAIPIIVSILASLLVSFTITPMLMARFGKLPDDTRQTLSARFSRDVEKAFNSLKNAYAGLLATCLRHKTTVIISTVALLIASFSLFGMGLIGFAFAPNIDQGEFIVNIDMNPQVSLYRNNQTTMQVEHLLLSKPEVMRVYTNVGSSGSRSGNSSKNNTTSISVKMIAKGRRSINVYDFSQQVKKEIMQIPGVRARVNIASISGSASEPIKLIVQGSDFEIVKQSADVLLDVVRNTPGTIDAKFSIDDLRQEVQVKPDRDKIARMGLSFADVGAALRVALAGNDDSRYSEGSFEYGIRVGIDDFNRTQAGDVNRLTFLNKRGEIIELNQIADISYNLSPSTLERTNRISSIAVRSNVIGRPSGTVGAEITAAMQNKLPEGITLSPEGVMEQQSGAFGSLAFAFLAAIVMIYLIMVALYNSLSDPLIVLVSVPLAIIGAFFALALTMNDLDIFSIIGLIVLIGLVAKNAILLVDFANDMRRNSNMNTFDALIEAGKERLRPILMTSFATIFGMLPIALASGNGAELKNGMAWVIIGGLTSSMLLTLLVVPVVYCLFDKAKVSPARFKRKHPIENIDF